MKSVLSCLTLVVFCSVFLGYDHDTQSPVFLPWEAFKTHCHIIGGTGKGKTTVIKAMLHQLFRAREKAAFFILDRMGSFTFDLQLWLASPYCPDHIRDRVVYVDAAREDVVMPFNPLSYTTEAHGYYKVGRATDVVLRAWASQNIEETPRLARWIHNAFWSAAQLGLTISDCSHFLMPGSELHARLLQLLPPLLQAEWAEIHQARGETARMLEAPRNRLKPFFDNSILRATFGSTRSRLNVLRFMQERKIVIFNLAPQNRLSPQIADAYGGMILNEVLATARSLPMGVRYPTFLLLDEFQRFVGPDIEEATPEVRQLGLRFICSHQSLAQLVKGLTDLQSIIWQLQTRIIFGVQGEDADIVANEIASVTYNPEKIKDEVYTRRQLLRDHKVVYLPSWSESEGAAETWNKTYGTSWNTTNGNTNASGWNHSDSKSLSYTRRIGDANPPYTFGNGKTDGRSGSQSNSTTSGEGSSASDGEGGSHTHSKSMSMSPSVLPVHEEFLELSRRSYYTFQEQQSLWAQQVRLLRTGQALLRLVDNPIIYRVDVKKHTPGYLEWDTEKIMRRRPEAIDAVHCMIEQNCASELFVSPQEIERETQERLQRVLNPAIEVTPLRTSANSNGQEPAVLSAQPSINSFD